MKETQAENKININDGVIKIRITSEAAILLGNCIMTLFRPQSHL